MATTTLQDVSLGSRAIGARTNFAGTGVTDLSAEEDRFINGIIDEGFFADPDSFSVAKGGAATMNVVVGSGTAKTDKYCVVGDDAGMENYLVRLESATETFALTVADASNARKDEVYLVVLDNAYDSSGKAIALLALRTGDPSGSPVAPGPDAGWDAYVLLATVDVPASAADILACTITDERVSAELNLNAVTADYAATAGDADTVDGSHASAFATSGHNHDAAYSTDDHVHHYRKLYKSVQTNVENPGGINDVSTSWSTFTTTLTAPNIAGGVVVSQRLNFNAGATNTHGSLARGFNVRAYNSTHAQAGTWEPSITIPAGATGYFGSSIELDDNMVSIDGDTITVQMSCSQDSTSLDAANCDMQLVTVYYIDEDSAGPSQP